MTQVFVGLDWAEDHHDVFVENDIGERLGGGRLPEGVDGVARFHELVAGHVDDPADVVVATERDRPRPVHRGARRSRVHGVGGQPDVDIALSRTALDIGRQVRPR